MTGDQDPHSQQLNQVLAEYLQAIEIGEAPNREELLTRYPTLADQLQSFFDQHDSLQQAVSPLRDESAEDVTIPPADPPRDEATLSSESNATWEIGSRVRYFGDYELLEEIARGGMGVVYKARQMSLNRIVALKMILAGQLASEEDVRRFHTEAEAAANLTIRASCRSTKWASTKASTTSRWATWKGRAWRPRWPRVRWRLAKRRNWSRTWPRRSPMPIRRA